eukprot:gene13597-14981_t
MAPVKNNTQRRPFSSPSKSSPPSSPTKQQKSVVAIFPHKHEAAGLNDHLSVLHNLMYGFSGSSKTRVRNILNFSGYPAEVNRDNKLKSMYASEPLRYGNNHYIRLFLRLFGLESAGKKEELFNRFLDFMFHPY